MSGIDIAAGMDWRREIRSALVKSHLLLLLFTAPSKNWDWCLYETGLYTRFDLTDANSVVCLFAQGEASPSPLADLQGVPADAEKVGAFLDLLCRRTWEISDDWRRGALAPEVAPAQVKAAGRAIAEAFRRSGSTSTYYPCHRLVLSLSESDDLAKGIPETARVMVGPNDTSDYTMSLFDLAAGSRHADVGRSAAGRGRNQGRLAPRTRLPLPPGRRRAVLPTDRGPHARRRYEPGSGAGLPSDPLQHPARAHGRAGV